ncbi:MAG: hypothetical protein P4L35_09890 [Ignavibacteriaceae bacterium]|nr:hypothetical protein [Ignavibacteriaceae bacterium]
MKKILWIILSGILQLYPQNNISPIKLNLADTLSPKMEVYGTPHLDPLTGTIDEKDSGAVLIKSDRTVQRYSTIKSAVTSADANSTILVFPGTYSDSLNIATENITIKGISNGSVIISGALYITASRGRIETCTITGNLTLMGQTIKALFYIKDCHLENNISVGTASAAISSNVFFIDCLLGKDDTWTAKTIYINVSAAGAPDIYFKQCHSPEWTNSHNIILSGYSRVNIEGSATIVFNSITINGGSGYDRVPMLFFKQCYAGIMNLTLTGYTEISCNNSEIVFYSTAAIISNHCEFDMFNCKIDAATNMTINFNSLLPSRWSHCQGTTNIASIAGTGLAYLHIQYSFFQQTNVPTGLGSDDANTWGAWVDY